MDKYIYNEKNGLWYELRGDYYIPCLELPAAKEERYIREHNLHQSSDKRQTAITPCRCIVTGTELFDRLMKQWAEREGITETLKAENQMLWVGRMNALRSAVTETVNAEVIFV